MKYLISVVVVCLALLGFSWNSQAQNSDALTGAWELQDNGSQIKTVVIFEDGYFTRTVYNPVQKQFIESLGGTYQFTNNSLFGNVEFATEDKGFVGQNFTLPLTVQQDEIKTVAENGEDQTWHRIDKGAGKLAGNWRIAEREQDGKMHTIPAGDRKTVKILSGTRFQWAAINTATGEFFGTGGGTYTFKNGKYTENIEFFSRDSTRVGKSLSFEGEVKNNQWHHKGLSSKGNPIYEIWVKAR